MNIMQCVLSSSLKHLLKFKFFIVSKKPSFSLNAKIDMNIFLICEIF